MNVQMMTDDVINILYFTCMAEEEILHRPLLIIIQYASQLLH